MVHNPDHLSWAQQDSLNTIQARCEVMLRVLLRDTADLDSVKFWMEERDELLRHFERLRIPADTPWLPPLRKAPKPDPALLPPAE